MPLVIGVTAGLLDGLGISMWNSGEQLMGFAWVVMGLALAGIMYLRVRESLNKTRRPD
ncbi:MAG: hypothetical protein ACRKGH_00565 [Dehalogenimonas sp.]